MAIERSGVPPARKRLPFPAIIVIGGLAVFGALSAGQWVLTSLLGVVKLVLVIVVVIAAAAWVISAKANR